LGRALAARSNLLVARAAEIAGEWELSAFAETMVAAFDRFLEDPVRRDPTCAAKIAIVEALNRLEYRDAAFFTRGLRHVQLEPVYGGREDTAAPLRAECALGLARSDPPDVLLELASLLADPEPDARIGAARAIAYASRPGGAPLLWFKAHVGDSALPVVYECFAALLTLEPGRALPFVGNKLGAEDSALAETAALALGASRLPGALPLLVAGWENASDPAFRRAALTAIAALGDAPAFDFLLSLLADAPIYDAEAALGALSLFRNDERRWRKIERERRKRADLPGER
jgi:HEAT repeat protein